MLRLFLMRQEVNAEIIKTHVKGKVYLHNTIKIHAVRVPVIQVQYKYTEIEWEKG